MVKGVIITVASLAIAMLLIWTTLPYLTRQVLRNQLDATGWLLHRLSLQRPTGLSWRWSRLEVSSSDRRTAITASNIQLRPGLEQATDLSVQIGELSVTIGASEQQQVLDPANWLSWYRQSLPLIPERGQIERLELCFTEVGCNDFKLLWWQQTDGLVVRLTRQQSEFDQVHLLMNGQGLRLEMFHGGPRPFFISLQAQASKSESINTVKLSGEMLLVRDDWFELLQQEITLPQGLDLDWRTLNIRYLGDLPLLPVDSAASLLQNIRGRADLSWSGRWHWRSEALSVYSAVPHSATLSRSRDTWQIALHPGYEVILQRQDLPQLHATTLSELACQYHPTPASLGCAGGQVKLSGPLGVAELSMELLIDQFELKDLLSITPQAAVDLSLKVQDPRQQWLRGRARVDLSEGEIRLVGEDVAIAEVPLQSFVLSHSTVTGVGNLNSSYQGPVGPFNLWLPGDFKGALNLQLAVDWQDPLPDDWLTWPLSTDLRINATDLSAEIEDNHLGGGRLNLNLTGWPRLTTAEPAHMSWRSIDVGFPITQLEMDFNIDGDVGSRQIDLQGLTFRADTLGGSISSDDFQFNLTEVSGSVVIQLHQLDLLQILSLEDEQFHSEGKLIGQIPVTIEKGNVIIENGSVQTVAPGGLLQYNPSESVVKLAESSPQMATVLSTLKNFHYDSLDAGLNYGSDGVLRMNTSIKGYNPDYEQGREIHFNLTVEEDIIALLNSLKLSDRLTDRIENRMQ